jgi:polysaccharide biosynthesis protein PslG
VTQAGICCSEAVELSAADQNRVFAGIAATGATWTRIAVPWGALNSSRGVYAWGLLDTAVAAAQKAGLQVLLNIVFPRPSLGFLLWGTTTAADMAIFAGTLAKRYAAQGVSHYEIWNEPNDAHNWTVPGWFGIPSPAVSAVDYVAWLKPTYTAIHNAQPSATVISAGLEACVTWANTNMDPLTFITQAYTAGLGSCTDAIGYHPYSLTGGFVYVPPTGSQQFIADLFAIHNVMSANGDAAKQIWATEWGFPTITASTIAASNSAQPAITQELQAQYMAAQWAIMSQLPFLGPAFLYQYRDWTNPGATYSVANADQNLGLVTSSYVPKTALGTMTALWRKP